MIEHKITAQNYAAKARRDLLRYADLAAKDEAWAADAFGFKTVASIIGQAVHFAMPDGGRLFDDNLRGVRGREVRLPYPAITIEYFVSEIGEPTEMLPTSAPKRMIVAVEAPKSRILADNQNEWLRAWVEALASERVIATYVVNEVRGIWTLAPCAWLMPRAWDAPPAGVEVKAIGSLVPPARGKDANLTGKPFPILPTAFEHTLERHGEALGLRMLFHDISDELTALLEFCEALTCSNVRPTTVQEANPAVNRRRIRDGKLPIYETKVLTIDVPVAKGGGKGTSAMGERASPREHLRRGHIREMQDGRRIWVSSAVIGAGNPGRVEKTYRVRAA